MKGIAYYISAHGYGHGVRSCDIMRELLVRQPDLRLHLVTMLPASFLRNRLPERALPFRRRSLDVGMVQRDSVRVDIPATLDRIGEVYRRREALINAEAEFLERERIGLVAADIPAIPIEAAKRVGIPAIAIGNFSWNWIYSEFAHLDPRWSAIISQLEEGYAQADLLLRLPFAGDMRIFPKAVDIPLLATPGRVRRTELAELSGCSPDKTLVLISFSSLAWTDEALDRVAGCREHVFFTVKPLAFERDNIYAIDREDMPFSDVLASVDVVLSKPGFGLVSECIVNRKPLIYTNRTEFLEYPVLVAGIKRYLKHAFLPQKQLYAGRLTHALDAIRVAPAPRGCLPDDGAKMAAVHLLEACRT